MHPQLTHTLNHPPPTITHSSQSSQKEAEGVGCLDTAGGQATGSDKDQIESDITGPAAGSLPPQNKTKKPSYDCVLIAK